MLTVVFGLLLLVLWYVCRRFDARGRWEPARWKPFTDAKVWTGFVVPGLTATLSAAAVGMVLALTFGILFAVGRLSEHWWLRVPAGAVVRSAAMVDRSVSVRNAW